jgi:hypothetical protein
MSDMKTLSTKESCVALRTAFPLANKTDRALAVYVFD